MPDLHERWRQAVKCKLKGLGLKEPAELCGTSRNTVNEAKQWYKAGGWKTGRVWKPVGQWVSVSSPEVRPLITEGEAILGLAGQGIASAGLGLHNRS
jgi:hypothetical protein